jgi:hypothetical protein
MILYTEFVVPGRLGMSILLLRIISMPSETVNKAVVMYSLIEQGELVSLVWPRSIPYNSNLSPPKESSQKGRRSPDALRSCSSFSPMSGMSMPGMILEGVKSGAKDGSPWTWHGPPHLFRTKWNFPLKIQ